MTRALELAKKGLGTVTPNPMVGAVIVKEGRVIGEGFHVKKGGPHAEVVAVENATESVEGASVFCTLEPCCHTNKLTPPCTDLLIKNKVAEVYVATLDPNPEVAGRGIQKLNDAGIKTHVGLLKDEADKLNKVFYKHITTGLPYLHLKMAMTLDGRMASSTGSSKWITSPTARAEVHELRRAYDAVMVGMNTLINDNPSLNTREGEKVVKENKKIVLGNVERLKDLDLKISEFINNKENIILINTGVESAEEDHIIPFKGDFESVFKELGARGITSILVEGGPKLISSLLEKNLYDEMTIYIAPKLIGNGSSVYENTENLNMESALKLEGKWRLLDTGEAVYEVKK